MTLHELYCEIDRHLLQDEKPSEYLSEIYDHPLFSEHPFSMLHALRKTEQSPVHHPEGNVWNHTAMVVDEAAKLRGRSQNQRVFMWAALLHDIGKPKTTEKRSGKITAYDHDKVGAKLSKDFLSVFTDDAGFINDVSQLILYHMQILFVVKDMRFADVKGILANTDIRELALLGLCDRMGRTDSDIAKEEKNIEIFLGKCLSE
jgi:putative nucleotidyltransferase with HDIG domain